MEYKLDDIYSKKQRRVETLGKYYTRLSIGKEVNCYEDFVEAFQMEVFDLIYKIGDNTNPNERFVRAVVVSSNDNVAKKIQDNPEYMYRWYQREYLPKVKHGLLTNCNTLMCPVLLSLMNK